MKRDAAPFAARVSRLTTANDSLLSASSEKTIALDLCACQGSSGSGLAKRHHVIAVDKDPQPRHPLWGTDDFIQQDALTFLRDAIDDPTFPWKRVAVLWVSSNCQPNSSLLEVVAGGQKPSTSQRPDLLPEFRELLREVRERFPWVLTVMENVRGARDELINPHELTSCMTGEPLIGPHLFEFGWAASGGCGDSPISFDDLRRAEVTTSRCTGAARRECIVKKVPPCCRGNCFAMYSHPKGLHAIIARTHLWGEAIDAPWMDIHGFCESVPPSMGHLIGLEAEYLYRRYTPPELVPALLGSSSAPTGRPPPPPLHRQTKGGGGGGAASPLPRKPISRPALG